MSLRRCCFCNLGMFAGPECPWCHSIDGMDASKEQKVVKKTHPESAVELLDKLGRGDPEASHGDAEDIVLGVLRYAGHEAVADAFERARDRCDFWYA